jgi:hypothetical protein
LVVKLAGVRLLMEFVATPGAEYAKEAGSRELNLYISFATCFMLADHR